VSKSSKKSTYDLCIAMLGKDVHELERLSQEINLEPQVELKSGIHLYMYPECGILLLYFELFGCFSSVHFFVNTPAVEEGYVERFSQSFLNDIKGQDSIEEVELKMGLVPARFERTGCHWEVYELDHYIVEFIFDASTKRMLSVTAKNKDVGT